MNRLLKTMITSLLIIGLLGVALFFIISHIKGDPLDDLVKHSYETPEVTTDLKDGSFVKIQFQILTDGKKAKNEISKRDFQLKNILIKELAHFTEEEFSFELENLEKTVQRKLNEIMTEGKIIDVYAINKILQ